MSALQCSQDNNRCPSTHKKIKKMKYNKNIALVWLVAIFSALMTSCRTSQSAADEYRQYLSERQDVAEKLGLEEETSVIIPEVVEDSLRSPCGRFPDCASRG